jgi:glycerophosphoryl diester phosphodiesterase
MHSDFYYIGHRGCRINCDENTMPAFNSALECGANYIEFDIHKTKDNKLIIIHDKTLERTTDGFGHINELFYKEILNLRTKRKHAKIPLLFEVVASFKNKIKFMIELKGENVRPLLVEFLEEQRLIDNCILSSRNLSELCLLKFDLPESQICYNITKGVGFTLEQLYEQKKIPKQINYISLGSHLINQKFINICHRQNVLVFSWNFINYIKPFEKIKSLISIGIDGILFDDCRNIVQTKNWIKINP